jgi:hypothetical protein
MAISLLPFHGWLCDGLQFQDGRSLALLKWDSTPTRHPAFSQVWVTAPNGTRTCYIDPAAAEDVFREYHRFDAVIGSHLRWDWSTPSSLSVSVAEPAIRIHLQLAHPIALRIVNLLLRTRAQPFFARTGATETGMQYRHQPNRIAIVASATWQSGAARAVDAKPKQCVVASWCTHYLQACEAVA